MWTCDIKGNWISEDFSSFVLSSGLDNCNFLHGVARQLQNGVARQLQLPACCRKMFTSELKSTSGPCNQLKVHFRTSARLLQAGWFCHLSWLLWHLRDYATTLKLTVFLCSLLLQAETWLTAVWLNWCNLIPSKRTLLNFVYSAPSSTRRSFLPRPIDNLGAEFQTSKLRRVGAEWVRVCKVNLIFMFVNRCVL